MKIMHLNGDVVFTDSSDVIDPPSLVHRSLEAIDPVRYHRDFSVVELAAEDVPEYYVVFFPRLRVRCIDHMHFSDTQSIYQFTIDMDEPLLVSDVDSKVTLILSVTDTGKDTGTTDQTTKEATVTSLYYAGEELEMTQPIPLDRLVAYLMVALFSRTCGRIHAADYAEMVRILQARRARTLST